jgi:hypothetical protein
VQRLRKEVETADNANGSKVSIPSFLGLNNNNHITNNNETKHETAANGFETKHEAAANGFETTKHESPANDLETRKPSKENYEEVVRNGDVHHSPAQDNDCAK